MQKTITRVALAAPLLLSLWLGGCGLGKVAECQKLIQAANAESQAIQSSTAKLGSNPSDIDTLAVTFDKAAGDVGAVALKDEKLKGFQKDYKDMMTRAAKSCRDMSAAVRSKKLADINKAKGELDSVGGNESKVVNGINGYCTL